ncbi:PP2C family protein-serine/threonine phosphatase [Actinacidiphila soli]|uniref:PP2C family protein-serine/threonine phosphatase n=1 Tax=Actinacidiphila soli TaxID=2487275 RepID=UPI0019D0273A|nr:PP2C family protein-serine/threonine phosphatase [Actinacidiphila soli]
MHIEGGEQRPARLEDFVTGPPTKPKSYPFVPGDRLLLYTDGVIEARNRGNEFFALPEAMEAACRACTPPEFLEQLHQELIRHTEDRLADDVAMLVVDRLDEGVGRQAGSGSLRETPLP